MVSPHSWWCGLVAATVLPLAALPVLVPGAALWLRVADRVRVPAPLSLLLALAASAVAGYATFWLYLASPRAGRVASWALVGASVALLVVPRERRRLAGWLRDPEVAIPATLLAGSAYFALTWYLAFVPNPPPKSWSWITHAYGRVWIPDASLPLVVAHKVSHGTPLHAGAFAADTLARTPLQAGIVLVEYPAWRWLESVLPGAVTVLYETLGVVLQSFWVAAAWGLARALGFGRARAAWLLVALVPSHFFVLNAAYPWPKLLAASFVVGSFCLLLLRPPRAAPLGWIHAGVAAGLACLGLLAHPGVAPSLIGFALLLLPPRHFPGWRSVVAALPVVVMLCGPWAAYQMAQPIDYSLTKRFVAGADSEDPRSTGALVREAWLDREPGALAREKWDTLRALAGFDPPKTPDAWRRLRLGTRDTLGPSLGILNLGWVVVLLGLLRRSGASNDPLVRRTLAAALVCLAVSLLVLFESQWLRHTSYATVTLLFVGLGAALLALPAWLAGLVLGAHVLLSLVVFSTQLEAVPFTPAVPTLICALAAYGALLLGLLGAGRAGWLEPARGVRRERHLPRRPARGHAPHVSAAVPRRAHRAPPVRLDNVPSGIRSS